MFVFRTKFQWLVEKATIYPSPTPSDCVGTIRTLLKIVLFFQLSGCLFSGQNLFLFRPGCNAFADKVDCLDDWHQADVAALVFLMVTDESDGHFFLPNAD